MTLAFLNDGNIQLMQRIDSLLGEFDGENLVCLIDDSPPEREPTIEFLSRFLKPSAVEAVHHPDGLLDHMKSYFFEFLDYLFLAFRVFLEELIDPKKKFSPRCGCRCEMTFVGLPPSEPSWST